MTLHCPPHLHTIAIIRVYKVRTQEQENNRRLRKMLIRLLVTIFSDANPAFMPRGKQALTFEQTQMLLQRSTQRLVSLRIGQEYFSWYQLSAHTSRFSLA